MTKGENLPAFQALQLDFAAYIRNPDRNPLPGGVEARRMNIYADLFYRNIEGFLASTFRVFRAIVPDPEWHDLVRDFVHRHRSESPYFIQIPEEFLEFLADEAPADPRRPFRLELCHYEWVELALDFAADESITYIEDEVTVASLDDADWRVSPVAWPLQYQFPVHRIGPAHQPTGVPSEPTCLIVYRNRYDRVKFMESNPATFRLLQHLDAVEGSARVAVETVAAELDRDVDGIAADAAATFERLRRLDILIERARDIGA